MPSNTNTAVQILMTDALNAIRPSVLIEKALGLLEPKRGKWNGRKKLTEEEAIAVMRVITSMAKRYGLKPTVALARAKTEGAAGATYKFFLTEDEMSGVAPMRARNRLNLTLKTHVESVRYLVRAAREAHHEVSYQDLLDEIGAEIPEFLEQFRAELAVDENIELAEDLQKVADWLSSPRSGVELVRFLREAYSEGLIFNPETGEMESEGDDGDTEVWNAPSIPLMIRIVGEASGEHLIFDESVEAERRVKRASRPGNRVVASAQCYLAYHVHLQAHLDSSRRAIELTFTLNPVTYVSGPITEDKNSKWLNSAKRRYQMIRGFLVPGCPRRIPGSEIQVRMSGDVTEHCTELFSDQWDRFYSEEHGWNDEGMYYGYSIPVTPENCRILLEDKNRFRLDRLFFKGISEESILPQEVELEGIKSNSLRDRFNWALYNTDKKTSLAGQLLTEAKRRCAALEAHQLRSVAGLRRRQMEFRRWMRG